MPADQAAGLRRRSARQPVRCIHVFFGSAESSTRLAQALYQRGRTSLLVDMQGRLFADSPTRSLFDWRQQLERGQLNRLPLPFGDGWHAPGVRADEPALVGIAQHYDYIVLDEGPAVDSLVLMPAAAHAMVIEVNAMHESMQCGYALLKTLSRVPGVFGIGLWGDPVACDRIRGACAHFLGSRFARGVYSAANEDDAFAALAVRMAGEETGLTTRYITGKP
jgi:hypothetical protein